MAAPAAGGIQYQVMECARQYVGKLIGPAGSIIQLLQQKSGCRVQIDQNVPEGMPCKINMQGNPQTLSNAAQLIAEIITNGPARVQSMPAMPTSQAVPQAYGAYGAAQSAYPAAYPGAQAYAMPQQQQMLMMPQQQQQQQQQQRQYPASAYAPASTASAAPTAAPSASPWTEYTSETGHKYWFNSQTNTSQWERPAGI